MTEEILRVICQICREEIAVINTAEIKYPLSGKMFKSKAPQNEIRAPFHDSHTWQEFRCLYGPHRPLLIDNEILTSKGLLIIPRDGSPGSLIDPHEIGKESVYDRPFDMPPAMSDEEAEAIVRSKKENVNVQTDPQQKQPQNDQSVQKEEKNEIQTVNGVHATADGPLLCPKCPGKQFRTQAGLVNHTRIVHKAKV